ncbi:TrbI/VirB10 family protein [Brucella sp. NBRC 12950]|uniref:TrbI/VirB10 family protein n=1 Tax=Brucella sp. NBRC 12950 TaxID=2994518 RepID=UPI0025556ABB|nr:TrbI/VirB10 family protein [Brucella sp. NBRC 12950]
MDKPTNEPAEHAAPVKDPNKPSENVQPGQTSTAVDPDPTLQRRLMFIQQVEDRRLAKYAEALEADSKGQMNNDWHSSSGNLLEGQGGRHGHAALDPLYPDPRIDDLAGNDPVRYGSVGESSNMVSENRQAEKRAFLADTPEADVYLRRQRTNAIAPSLEVKAGTVIPGVMISGINSDLPGTIIAQVRQDVYDSATGGNLLIPAGAKLIGTYDSSLTLGQQRALVVWQRIIYPDSSSLSLGNMPGTDMGGYAGFNDKVNNHYMRIFSSGLLLSAFSAGIQLSQPQARHGDNISASQIIAGSLGQQLGQIGMQMAQRNMNIQPTIEIRPGYQFNVMVTKDIILPPWHGHPLAAHP